MSLATALERAAEALPSEADVIRPANGDPDRLLAGLSAEGAVRVLVSLLGGSRIQIGGPTGAFVVIVSGIIAAHGLSGLLVVTMMAGVILLFLALTGLAQAVRFIPRPVVIGFTNGIALLIATTQIKDFLGLRIAEPLLPP